QLYFLQKLYVPITYSYKSYNRMSPLHFQSIPGYKKLSTSSPTKTPSKNNSIYTKCIVAPILIQHSTQIQNHIRRCRLDLFTIIILLFDFGFLIPALENWKT
ncbi:hypothetical protein PanWU01x14_016430, partial [Parasponia andersonii]